MSHYRPTIVRTLEWFGLERVLVHYPSAGLVEVAFHFIESRPLFLYHFLFGDRCDYDSRTMDRDSSFSYTPLFVPFFTDLPLALAIPRSYDPFS